MTAADRTAERVEVTPNAGTKEVILISDLNVVGATDYLTITLADFGISKVISADEFVHTTDYEVIERGTSPATSLTAGVFKIVTTTGNDTKRRVIVVKGV